MPTHLTTGDEEGKRNLHLRNDYNNVLGILIRECAVCKNYLSSQTIEMKGDYDITSGLCLICLEDFFKGQKRWGRYKKKKESEND